MPRYTNIGSHLPTNAPQIQENKKCCTKSGRKTVRLAKFDHNHRREQSEDRSKNYQTHNITKKRRMGLSSGKCSHALWHICVAI